MVRSKGTKVSGIEGCFIEWWEEEFAAARMVRCCGHLQEMRAAGFHDSRTEAFFKAAFAAGESLR